MLSTSADEGAVLNGGDLNTEDDAVAQLSSLLLELSLNLGNKLRFATQMDIVGRFTWTGARSRVSTEEIARPSKETYNRMRPACALGSVGPPQRVMSSFRPCPPGPIKVRWNLFSMTIESLVSSWTESEMAKISALASAIAVLVPRRVIVDTSPVSADLSMSICAPVLSLMILILEPPRPRMRATERVGTVNLIVLFDSFSNA